MDQYIYIYIYIYIYGTILCSERRWERLTKNVVSRSAIFEGDLVRCVCFLQFLRSSVFRCGSIPGALVYLRHKLINWDFFSFALSHSLWPNNKYCISLGMKNQQRHWVWWCWVENGPPRRQRTLEQRKVVNVEVRYQKATTEQSVVLCAQYPKRFEVWPQKVWWGRHKEPLVEEIDFNRHIWRPISRTVTAHCTNFCGPSLLVGAIRLIDKFAHLSKVSVCIDMLCPNPFTWIQYAYSIGYCLGCGKQGYTSRDQLIQETSLQACATVLAAGETGRARQHPSPTTTADGRCWNTEESPMIWPTEWKKSMLDPTSLLPRKPS